MTRGTGVSGKELADYATNSFGPFYDLATVLGVTWLATVLQVDAIISPGDTGLVYMSTTARLSFALQPVRGRPDLPQPAQPPPGAVGQRAARRRRGLFDVPAVG